MGDSNTIITLANLAYDVESNNYKPHHCHEKIFNDFTSKNHNSRLYLGYVNYITSRFYYILILSISQI